MKKMVGVKRILLGFIATSGFFLLILIAEYQRHYFSVKYGNTNKENETCLFHPRDKIDLMHVMFLWMSYASDVRSLSLDNMRDYLGIDKTNAHDAIKDVEDCANILIRFLRLHKNLSSKIQFKGAFKA